MKLFAIRDRLLDYFQQPFAAHTAQDVMAALSMRLTQQEPHDPIAQAPHQFQLWQVGEVEDQTGHLTANKEFIADCSSFIRSSIRPNTRNDSRNLPHNAPPIESRSSSGGDQQGTDTDPSPTETTPPSGAQHSR